MTAIRLLVFVLLALAAVPPSGTARAAGTPLTIPGPDELQILTTTDGSTMIGRITRITEPEIEFRTSVGVITIPRSRIQSIRTVPASSIRNGKYWHPDPNATRLLFAPTGRMLAQGKGYFADYYVFFPTINYGVTDRFSLGGGMSLFPTGSLGNQLYFLTPKIGLQQSDWLNTAAGALIIKIPDFGDEDTPLASIVYAVGTLGGSDHNFTLGIGYGLIDTEPADRPLIVLGGKLRLSRRTAFITENWIIPGESNALISYGIRLFSESLSTDLALLNTTGEDSVFPGIPYVDFVWNF